MMRKYRHYDTVVATRNGMIQFQDVSGSHGDRMVKAVDGGQLPSAMRSALLQQNLLNVSMHTRERKEYLQAVQTVFMNAGIKFDPRCWKSIVWITDDECWQLHRVWGNKWRILDHQTNRSTVAGMRLFTTRDSAVDFVEYTQADVSNIPVTV